MCHNRIRDCTSVRTNGPFRYLIKKISGVQEKDRGVRRLEYSVVILNETARFLWKLIPAAQSEDELVDALLEEYMIDRETASKDVHAFLSKLQEDGIL